MILVAGATGNVGSELVRVLASAGEPVRALSRRPVSAALPAGVTAVGADLNEPDTLADALNGTRGMFLLSGYRDMPGLLRRAREAGAEQVVLLSGSSAGARDLDNAISRYMVASEAALRDSGLAWTILRPVSFMSNTLQWAEQLRRGDVVRAPFADVPVAPIDPYDIAAVAGQALLFGGHDGRVYPLTGPESLRPADRVRVLGTVLGRELRFVGQTDTEARTEMSAAMPDQYVDAFFRFFADGMLDESAVLPTVAEVTGRPPHTFRQWAEAHAAAFS
ncbi:MAG TPA: NAD(P)H-binding protein [Jatrophihabitantaceae bacterium]|jgi:uncharacterized protein YbjT (DUF2867 family)